MSPRESGRFNPAITSFEDLRGLRAEGYIRDSTVDQMDGFGPTIQKINEQRFAETYGLVLGCIDRLEGELSAKASLSLPGVEHEFVKTAGC